MKILSGKVVEQSISYEITEKCRTKHYDFKLTVTVTEMTINGNKSNPLTVTVTEIPVTETLS